MDREKQAPAAPTTDRVEKLRIAARRLNSTPVVHWGGHTWEVHADTCLRDRGDGQGVIALPWGDMPEPMRIEVMAVVRRTLVAQDAAKHGLEDQR
jgi:hypothetical protein